MKRFAFGVLIVSAILLVGAVTGVGWVVIMSSRTWGVGQGGRL